MNKPRFDERVVCCMLKLEYDFLTRKGVLYVPGMNCTDFSGCIGLFKGIDAKVEKIAVINEHHGLDITYVLLDGKWVSVEPKR